MDKVDVQVVYQNLRRQGCSRPHARFSSRERLVAISADNDIGRKRKLNVLHQFSDRHGAELPKNWKARIPASPRAQTIDRSTGRRSASIPRASRCPSSRHAYLLDLCDPVPDGVKGLLIRYVINQKNPLSASEIGGRDGAETLLPSGVPDLQLDSLGITGERMKRWESHNTVTVGQCTSRTSKLIVTKSGHEKRGRHHLNKSLAVTADQINLPVLRKSIYLFFVSDTIKKRDPGVYTW